MSEKNEKKKKDKDRIKLPKAWQSVKHREEMAQTRATYDDAWSAIGTILIILVIAFILLGGVNQRKLFGFFFDWSKNAGESVSNWLEGGSIVTNENGIYIDPTGETGDKIGGDDKEETTNSDSTDTTNNETIENQESQNDEVQNE